MKKYELTNEIKQLADGTTVFRIKALKDFSDVKAGDLGGFVQSEANLSHEGDCWVYGDAEVAGNAQIYGDAKVYGEAEVAGTAWVYDNAQVYGNARVYADAQVYGEAEVFGNALVTGRAHVYGNAEVSGDAIVRNDDGVCGTLKITHTWKPNLSEEIDGSKAVKHDSSYVEKPPLDLIPANALLEVGRVFGFGAQKYAAENWRKGMEHRRLAAAAIRHVYQYLDGENLDPESNLEHLAHAVASLLMLIESRANGYGVDNRHKGAEND